MALLGVTLLMLANACAYGEPTKENEVTIINSQKLDSKNDLDTAASTSHGRRYSEWSGSYTYPDGYSGYGVIGYGTLDDKYNYNSYYSGVGGYDDSLLYNGYNGIYSGYSNDEGYKGEIKGYDRYGLSGGNGGYGGYGGNGGLTSYYGYKNPYYQGAYHLGYGYYNKKPSYGNIYKSGITPSLVTGYRGYSR